VAAFRANGLVTLTTDFGLREPFVGIMKGVMLAHAAQLKFIDMAHDVSAFQPVEAGFWLAGALRYFPAGTLHMAVVDPGVGTQRALLVALANEQALLAPDNGLLAPLAARKKIDRIIRIDNTQLVQYGVSDVSATFHGRDVFAPPGEYLGLINSFEVLEVARARGNAAGGLNLAVGAAISAVSGGLGVQFRRS
jgi:S-adenosylmethionine hydrolase